MLPIGTLKPKTDYACMCLFHHRRSPYGPSNGGRIPLHCHDGVEASPTVNFKRNFVQPARKRSEPLRPRLLGRPTSARVARNMSAARAFPNTWPVTAAV